MFAKQHERPPVTLNYLVRLHSVAAAQGNMSQPKQTKYSYLAKSLGISGPQKVAKNLFGYNFMELWAQTEHISKNMQVRRS